MQNLVHNTSEYWSVEEFFEEFREHKSFSKAAKILWTTDVIY